MNELASYAKQIPEESNGAMAGFAGARLLAMAWEHPDAMFSELVINRPFTKNDHGELPDTLRGAITSK
jgi:hypothetical protein